MAKAKSKQKRKQAKKICGIIMPISLQRYGEVDYPPEYWNSLLLFLSDAIREAGYDPVPVWKDESLSSITPRIVKNISEFPLAVCVISALNPNVMMELGMRLCFNKPVLIIFDDQIVSLPFDIKDLESYQIPSHPIYSQYPEIKREIADRLQEMDARGYKTFMDNFAVMANTDKDGKGVKENRSQRIISKLKEDILNLSSRVDDIESVRRLEEAKIQRYAKGLRFWECDSSRGESDWLQHQA